MARALHYLRAVFTTCCVACCVFFIVLWIRSYAIVEMIERRTNLNHWYSIADKTTIYNHPGRVMMLDELGVRGGWIRSNWFGWRYRRYVGKPATPAKSWEFQWRSGVNFRVIQFPHWLPIVALGVAGTLPWARGIPRRFSLRTLLSATTAIAILLGFIMWTTRV